MKSKWHWRVSKNQGGMRLLQFLRENCPKVPSLKAIKRAIEGKLCTVNNRTETFSSFILKENDTVALSESAFSKEKVKAVKPERSIRTLYEDKELLIINKPAGLISNAKSLQDLPSSTKLVHRLDKETSGVLILAKTCEAKEKMIALFKERAIRKLYLAIVDGAIGKDEGIIDNFLGKKQHCEGKTIHSFVDKKKGLRAITYWKCLKRSKAASVICCEPYTGRTHQLRVHLSSISHPILGDTQYGKKFTSSLHPHRNLLHAYSVAFKHPITGKEIKVIAPIPADFKQALDALKISLI
jgi:23S rRNA pseudouridine955/2504/2580 synthase